MNYGFTLRRSLRVDVQIAAQPKNVNVMLMSEAQWTKYQSVRGSLSGGAFQYTKALSRQNVLDWSGSEVLPEGTWRVVIERPS